MAVDIGASSLKLLTAKLTDKKLTVSSLKHKSYSPLKVRDHYFVNINNLFEIVRDEIRQTVLQQDMISSIGFDTYANGYGYLDTKGRLLGLPYFYKDPRVLGILTEIGKIVDLEEIYFETGVNLTDIRILSQLYYDSVSNSSCLQQAEYFLMLPDLFMNFLTGEYLSERSMVSAGNLLSINTNTWCYSILEKFNLPTSIFPRIVDGGDRSAVLPIMQNIQDDLGTKGLQYSVVTSHDTETALLAAPMLDEDVFFISLGSSGICGMRTKNKVLNQHGLNFGFKNVSGAFGSNSFCQNFNGLWILEQCFRFWKTSDPNLTYHHILNAAKLENNNQTYIDIEHPILRTQSQSIFESIAKYVTITGQIQPATIGAITRCILESIVLYIKEVSEKIKEITDLPAAKCITVVGGGVNNALLMQMISDSLVLPLFCGSDCASAIGNVLMQMYSRKLLNSLSDIQEVAYNTSNVKIYKPSINTPYWNSAFAKFRENKKKLEVKEKK